MRPENELGYAVASNIQKVGRFVTNAAPNFVLGPSSPGLARVSIPMERIAGKTDNDDIFGTVPVNVPNVIAEAVTIIDTGYELARGSEFMPFPLCGAIGRLFVPKVSGNEIGATGAIEISNRNSVRAQDEGPLT